MAFVVDAYVGICDKAAKPITKAEQAFIKTNLELINFAFLLNFYHSLLNLIFLKNLLTNEN